jgi:hypothetical protein
VAEGPAPTSQCRLCCGVPISSGMRTVAEDLGFSSAEAAVLSVSDMQNTGRGPSCVAGALIQDSLSQQC